MSFNHRLASGSAIISICLLLALSLASATGAQQPELTVTIGNTGAIPGEEGIRLPVYLSNPQDTIAGFDLWIQMNRPDIAEFELNTTIDIDSNYWYCTAWYGDSCGDSTIVIPDTLYFACNAWQEPEHVCTDSVQVGENDSWDFFHAVEWDWLTVDTTEHTVGVIDTVGTLVGGWDLVSARSLGGSGYDMKISAIADVFGPPPVTGIPPQQNGVLLYLVLDAYNIPDTMTDRTVQLVPSDYPELFCFSDPQGNCVGKDVVQVTDSNCYVCNFWAGDVCLDWSQVVWPSGGVGCDSVLIDTVNVAQIDTSAVELVAGSLTLEASGEYGDFNGDGSVLDISDLVYLVSYMFSNGPAPDPLWTADCDQSGGIDIADLICWVEWMFPPQ